MLGVRLCVWMGDAGLKAVLTLSSTQSFGPDSSATFTTTYSHQQGIGMQVGVQTHVT